MGKGIVVAAVAACVATGCDTKDGETGESDSETGSETEGESDSETGDPVGGCGAEMTTVVSDLNGAIPEFESTPAEILASVEGTKMGEFSWAEAEEFVTTPYASTSSPLELTITGGGEVRLIEVEHHGSYPNGQEGGEMCSHRLEFDVELSFTTDDGVFALTDAAVVEYAPLSWQGGPSFYHEIDFAKNTGTLMESDFTISEGEFSAAILSAAWIEGAFDGSLIIEVLGDEWVGAGFLASFDAS